MCVISVFNYLLSIIILWCERVECRSRICKWKLLSVDRTFVAAFALLTSFRDLGILGNPGVTHSVILHSSPLGQLAYVSLLSRDINEAF